MAAAKGMLPLSNEELLEVLVVLSGDEEEGVRAAAASTIETLTRKSRGWSKPSRSISRLSSVCPT
jgi:hypothetical protein